MSNTMTISPNKWLSCFEARKSAVINLVCFPFGGAGASVYKPLAARLPESVQLWSVQLPGRENRFVEPFAGSPAAVVQSISDEINLLRLENTAFFGHSMGSDLALMCASLRHRNGDALPLLLALSGKKPPHLPNARLWADVTDAVLLKYVLSLGGIPPEAAADQDFLEMYLEKIRADYRLLESIQTGTPAALDVPLLIVRATDDPLLKGIDMQSWMPYSTRTPIVRDVDGGHFYFQSDVSELAGIVRLALSDIANLSGSSSTENRRSPEFAG